jgi:hypothetical protein
VTAVAAAKKCWGVRERWRQRLRENYAPTNNGSNLLSKTSTGA